MYASFTIMQVIRGVSAAGNRKIWSIGAELGRLSVEYHMGHTLTVSLGLGGYITRWESQGLAIYHPSSFSCRVWVLMSVRLRGRPQSHRRSRERSAVTITDHDPSHCRRTLCSLLTANILHRILCV